MNSKLTFLNEKGIDTNAGLSYLGDESLYNEILSDFKNGFINQMAEIRKAYENSDFANYVILVHALKSNCRTLGITSLSELAYNHEMKGKENDINYINEHINELFLKANEIYKILEEYFNM
ncbi:MAG: hypothetical protein E7167_00235 [Firmicutes bacterium]|nr:hypothetical protein [Bacillota bacterium]